MTEQHYEIEPRTPKETTESIIEVGDIAHDDETEQVNIHNMR